MSKKKLLSEAQVRRFIGLAGLNPLNEMNYNEEQEDPSHMMNEEEDDMGEMPPVADGS